MAAVRRILSKVELLTAVNRIPEQFVKVSIQAI